MEPLSSFRVSRSRVHETHQAMRQEILAALDPVLFGPVLGSEEARGVLEGRFAEAMGQSFACAVHSGTVGLFLALKACGVGPGNEVITVGNSDVSTTAAISHCGATPVLCDILEADYTLDPALVEPLITPRTAAILPVDLYGHPADVKSLREIADRHGLKIVEDAALAAGAQDHGRPVGAFADATVFSFAPLKPLGSVGNGGMVTTNDEGIARRLRLLCGYGHIPEVRSDVPGHQKHIAEGYNVPLDPLQAALVTVKLPYLQEWTEKRRALAAAYARGLQGLDVVLPAFRPESAPTFRSYTIRVKDQQAVYQGLRRAGVEAVLHYVPPVYRQPVYGSRLPGSDHLPATDRVAREIVCLPVVVEMEEADVQYAVDALRTLL
ncbi:MAG: DegT/DnrJ/EryC1/StrS family aminotransferase [Anaerolineae bacterium]